MNLIKKEFKYNLKNLLIWITVIVLFNLMFSSITDLVNNQNSLVLSFLEKMPETFLKAFNLDLNTLSRPEGLFGSEGMTFMFIFFGIFGITLASKIFAGEFDNKTIEYLLIKPFSRKKIFSEKVFVLSINTFLLFAFFLLTILLFFKLFVSENYSNIVLVSFSLYLFVTEFFFASLSILISLITKNKKLTNSIVMGILFFMYFGYSVTQGVKNAEIIRKISIFNYMSTIDTIKNLNGFYLNSFLILVISITVIFISMKLFEKQNILL
ncbi:MAG: ABC transporter permease subunit [Thermosipho sp. (in: Bacteria)]|nr:ABC transporter permease subunit [Thermosipho sp. (in: thermotogales)]